MPEPTDSNAAHLVERCAGGDRAAWSLLIDRYAGLVYAIARGHGLDESSADDVAQAVFSTLWRKIGDLRRTDSLVSWLSTTARRECWKVIKSRRRAGTVGPQDEPAVESLSDERLEALESASKVREALDELGGRCKELLVALFFTHGESDYAAVSEHLSIPIGSIGPTRKRCLAKLAALLDPSLG